MTHSRSSRRGGIQNPTATTAPRSAISAAPAPHASTRSSVAAISPNSTHFYRTTSSKKRTAFEEPQRGRMLCFCTLSQIRTDGVAAPCHRPRHSPAILYHLSAILSPLPTFHKTCPLSPRLLPGFYPVRTQFLPGFYPILTRFLPTFSPHRFHNLLRSLNLRFPAYLFSSTL
jgi:hypothetical protein